MSLTAVAGITSVLNHPDGNDTFPPMNFHVGRVCSTMPEPFIADSEAQTVTVLDAIRCLLLCELGERCFAEIAFAVQFTAVQ